MREAQAGVAFHAVAQTMMPRNSLLLSVGT
ncbi:hypothetical protein [Azospirillum argentinense]